MMGIDEIWKRFVKTGNVEFYIEYKKLQNDREFKNAIQDTGFSDQGNGRGGKRPPYNTFN